MKDTSFFVVVTFFTVTKQADFLGMFLNFMEKQYFVNAGVILDSVQPHTLGSTACLHFSV